MLLRVWRGLIESTFVTLSLLAVLPGSGQTSKLALGGGLLADIAGRLSARCTRLGLSVAWATVCLGIVPLVLLARHFELQDAAWLPLSAQLRIVMWNKIALLVPEAPVLGVGADMTYVIRPVLTEVPAAAQKWIGFPIPHPHNLYLQAWYELGLVGAALLAAFGILLLGQMQRFGPAQRPVRLRHVCRYSSRGGVQL